MELDLGLQELSGMPQHLRENNISHYISIPTKNDKARS
jgi:hypothetical protein